MNKLLFILFLLLLDSCKTATEVKNPEFLTGIIYAKNNKGIFKYDLNQKKSKQIIELDKTFLNNSINIINDSIILIGFKGLYERQAIDKKTGRLLTYPCSKSDSLILDSYSKHFNYNRQTVYSKQFVSVNLNNNEYFKYKTIKYTHTNFNTLTIDTTQFDLKGNKLYNADTSYYCSQVATSSQGPSYCDSERFRSLSNIVNGKQIISSRGNLIIKENGKEDTLLKFKGHFDQKYGKGYFQPFISKSGNKVIYRELMGLPLFGDNGKLYEMNLNTKEKKIVLKESCYLPKYSNDESSIIYSNGENIYIYNLVTKEKIKIEKGSVYSWNK